MHYITAGESHGSSLMTIVYDVPAGLSIPQELIDADLMRRQSGYGRSSRQENKDSAFIASGLSNGKTTGAPIAMVVTNEHQSPDGADPDAIIAPRPGHADLVGALKMNFDECRNVAERASARETAARVAAASIAREFLAVLGVEVNSYVTSIGDVVMEEDDPMGAAPLYKPLDVEMSAVRCPSAEASEKMLGAIDRARATGDTLGGTFRVVVTGLLPGLGSYVNPSDRLTARLGAAILSVPAIKGVEFGIGFDAAQRPGSSVHDPIAIEPVSGFTRKSNNAGGLEGGMTTGMPLIITAAMKPIPTLSKPLDTIDMETLEPTKAYTGRSDVCAVPAAAVVAEAEVAFVLASAYTEKFGCDNMADIQASIKAYVNRLRTVSR
ncbi:MAG: chorismate synthase [Eggerthellaceae bacterium]|nr:chorismate synthase [Eggerthellaceae bacterium]